MGDLIITNIKINILLPFKEKFDIKFASSVSITVKNNIKYSSFKNQINVFGKTTENPISFSNFIGVKKSKNIFKSRNKSIAESMCKYILQDSQNKHLIEIHNRPYLFKYIFQKLKTIPITIFFHNDPMTMKGSKSYNERKYLQQKAIKIYCVSNFIKKKFLDGFNEEVDNVHVLYNGVERLVEHFPKKNKEILFVGRLVREKGVHLFVDAINDIAKIFKDWNFLILGSSHLGSLKKSTKFSFNVSKKFDLIGNQTKFTGFLSHDEVQKKMQSASIIVVPSIWEEPYGLVVAEAMANGVAVIASKLGGIPEILGENGILLNEINKENIKNAIISLVNDKKKLKKYQNLSWKKFDHEASKSSKKLDFLRSNIIKHFFN